MTQEQLNEGTQGEVWEGERVSGPFPRGSGTTLPAHGCADSPGSAAESVCPELSLRCSDGAGEQALDSVSHPLSFGWLEVQTSAHVVGVSDAQPHPETVWGPTLSHLISIADTPLRKFQGCLKPVPGTGKETHSVLDSATTMCTHAGLAHSSSRHSIQPACPMPVHPGLPELVAKQHLKRHPGPSVLTPAPPQPGCLLPEGELFLFPGPLVSSQWLRRRPALPVIV